MGVNRRTRSDSGPQQGVLPAGILTDEDIISYANQYDLIVPFDPENAKYASYELHASANAQILIYHGEVTAHAPLPPVNGELIIEPGATVRIDTAESIRLPDNVMANIIGLGQLYACGVTVANTYVDPGSRGPIYLAVTNLGRRTVRIPVGEPIGRAQFHLLGRAVRTAHPGPVYRRSIQLRVNGEDATPSPASTEPHDDGAPAVPLIDAAAATQLAKRQEALDHRLTLLKLALYAMAGAWLGLLWAIAPTSGNTMLRIINGDGVPDIAKLAIGLTVPGLITLCFRDVRHSLAHLMSRRRSSA
ncbi:dCTP deaminase domain-containing protein [Streptomyces sp. UG1]|uniref:dCTP deaminase domain-containing protein n=1 Tax=Streptomyces sp. UG1 TaxID=3417652 RepID=UPI003CF726DD